MNDDKEKVIPIREGLVAITGHYITAIYLNQFLYWSDKRKDFDAFVKEERKRMQEEVNLPPTHGWIWKSSEQLDEETMLGLSAATVRKYISKLVDLGFLEQRRNPDYAYDQTYQYRPNILAIQFALWQKGYTLADYKFSLELRNEIESAISKIKNGVLDFNASNLKNSNAIPETTTKIKDKENNTTLHLPHTVPLPTSTKQSVNGGGYEDNMANDENEYDHYFDIKEQVDSCKDLLILAKLAGEVLEANGIELKEKAFLYKAIEKTRLYLMAKDHVGEPNTMMQDHIPAIGNMMANHSPDTGNMVSVEIGDHIGNVNKMVSNGNQVSPLPLGFATPLTNTQNMATNACNQQKRIVGQNSGNVGDSGNDKLVAKRETVAKTVKPAKPVVEKQPDFAQIFLERWCEEVLGYQIASMSWGREKRTVKALLTKGTDIETKFQDLAGSYRYMKQKAYCADRHVFIQEVASNLPAWIQAGRPSSQPVAKPQWQVAKDDNTALWDELVSLTGGVKSDGTKIPMKYGRNDGKVAKSLMSKQLLAILSRMTKDGMYSPLLEMTERDMKFAFNKAVKSSG